MPICTFLWNTIFSKVEKGTLFPGYWQTRRGRKWCLWEQHLSSGWQVYEDTPIFISLRWDNTVKPEFHHWMELQWVPVDLGDSWLHKVFFINASLPCLASPFLQKFSVKCSTCNQLLVSASALGNPNINTGFSSHLNSLSLSFLLWKIPSFQISVKDYESIT